MSIGTVAVSIPVHRPPKSLRWTVRSLLRQSYRDMLIVLVADGDDQDLEGVDGIRDSRLVRFATRTNGGPYRIHDIVRRATSTPFFTVHDADDFSLPGRLTELVDGAAIHGAAFSPQWVLARSRHPITTRAAKLATTPPPSLRYQAHHSGVFTRDRIDRVGYLASARVGFDALLVSLMGMTGPVWASECRSYVRIMRSTGLTSDARTGRTSELRRRYEEQFRDLYRTARSQWQAGARDFSSLVEDACDADVRSSVAIEVQRLRELL